jgi:ketosteroid isomerase-like protein
MSGAKVKVRTICMLATVLALSVGCSAQASQATAQKLCDRLNQSWANHDLNQVMGFYDSSFVSTDEQGKSQAFREFRKEWEQSFQLIRKLNPSTTVQDVRLEAGLMIVSYKLEWHYELYNQSHDVWVPMILQSNGQKTWEKKGKEWRIVRDRTFTEDSEVDPRFLEQLNRDAWQRAIDGRGFILKCMGPDHKPGDDCPR